VLELTSKLRITIRLFQQYGIEGQLCRVTTTRDEHLIQRVVNNHYCPVVEVGLCSVFDWINLVIYHLRGRTCAAASTLTAAIAVDTHDLLGTRCTSSRVHLLRKCASRSKHPP